MRKLQTTDVFSALRLAQKIGVREEFKEFALKTKESGKKKTKEELGFDFLFGVLEKATNEHAENEIYIFIADLLECKPEEVRTMKPITLFKELEKVADIEEWKDFFGYVRRLIMKK